MFLKDTYTALILTIAFVSVSSLIPLVDAQVMQSANYRIESDSLNVGGGYSSSSNYQLQDTTGEIATGESESETYSLKAGYQQMQEIYLALTNAANVTLSPSIGGVTGGTGTGFTVATATTDNLAGYELTIRASSSPAMQSGSDTIPDYTPVGANPDYSFTNSANESQFGFSPEGTDIPARFKDNGASCNTGTGNTTSACWDGLSTSAQTIARRTSANHPSGTATSIRFRVEIGSTVNQAAGQYVATTTLTLLPL